MTDVKWTHEHLRTDLSNILFSKYILHAFKSKLLSTCKLFFINSHPITIKIPSSIHCLFASIFFFNSQTAIVKMHTFKNKDILWYTSFIYDKAAIIRRKMHFGTNHTEIRGFIKALIQAKLELLSYLYTMDLEEKQAVV